MITLEDAISRLSKVKHQGKGYLALCPAHDDKKQSLSLAEKDGKLLMKCFAGCSFEDILSAIGNTTSSVQGLALNTATKTLQEIAESTPPKVVAVYDYQDEQGNVLYQIHRTDRKDFWQKKPNGENIGDTRRVLFRLPEVIKADTIFIVEGEKDVMTMNVLGFTATTVSGGANSTNWKPDFARYFKDKRVILLPDNDEPGLKFMLHVVEQLLPITDKVKLIELPKLRTKEDVTDWIQGGHTKKELLQLIAETKRIEQADIDARNDVLRENLAAPLAIEESVTSKVLKGSKNAVKIVNGAIIQHESLIPENQYQTYSILGVEGCIIKGGSSMWAGKPKVGKSELIAQIAYDLGESGESVLYLTEEPEMVWRERLRKRMELGQVFDKVDVAFVLGEKPDVLVKMIESATHTCFIVDTVRNLCGVTNENDNAEVSAKMRPFIAATRKTSKTIFFIHHLRKGEGENGDSIAGASAYAGIVDQIFEIHRDPHNNNSRNRIIKGWGRINNMESIMYEVDELMQFKTLGSPNEVDFEEVKNRIIDCMGEGEWYTLSKLREVMDTPKPGKTGLRKALDSLTFHGKLERDPSLDSMKKGGTYQWLLSKREETQDNSSQTSRALPYRDSSSHVKPNAQPIADIKAVEGYKELEPHTDAPILGTL